MPWDKVLIKVTESAMKHGTYGQFSTTGDAGGLRAIVDQPWIELDHGASARGLVR